MKLIEILNQDKLSLSFEVFPPKTDDAFESVKYATEQIAELSPSYMSVTYGAGGGTSRYTLDIAKNINQMYGVVSLAHLTCVSSDRETVRQKIEEIKTTETKKGTFFKNAHIETKVYRSLEDFVIVEQARRSEKEKKREKCPICGKYDFPTKDHVPPQCCGNSGKTLIHYFFAKKNGQPDIKESQSGIHYKHICADCNNNVLGSKFDQELKKFYDCV